MMQSTARKPYPVRARLSSVSSGGETKQVRKVHTRKVPYRVGYSWNKGGRLKELRIRHLARKFLKIWMQNTFGRNLPHKAKSHYESVVLRRAFGGWRDEWWTSRREWSLTMRAECHYRYYLYNLAFHSWRTFMPLQKEKKSKIQNAQSFAERQQMRLVLYRWKDFTEMRQIKNRMLESALELNRLTTLHSTWGLWQTKWQQHQDLHVLEDQVLKQRALTLQRRTWLQWKEMHTAACCQREKESKAALHFIFRLKRKTLGHWKRYVSHHQTKRKLQAVAQRVHHLHLVMTCWTKWSSALHRRQYEEERRHSAGRLAVQSTQRRALEHWKAYVTLCREEDEKNRIAGQHYHHHLLCAGLHGLSLHVMWNKTHRLNNNMAVQHHHQTIKSKYWKLWQVRLEEAEDRSFQPLAEMVQTNHRTSVLSSCFYHWREKLAEQRRMQDLEHRADILFAESVLPRCFNSWVDFTLQRRLREQRIHKAEVYNQRRQYAWVFYTWWGRSKKHKEQMLAERMAILHEEQCKLQRAWDRWKQRAEQQINEEEKQTASDRLYRHTLLRKTVTQWKDNSAEIRDRRNLEQQACRQGDLRCMRWAVEKWKKAQGYKKIESGLFKSGNWKAILLCASGGLPNVSFVQSQRVKKSRLKQMQYYHEVKILKYTFVEWKMHQLQRRQIYDHAEELYRQQQQNFLRKGLSVWRENAVELTEDRLKEQQAQGHFQNSLQRKVFLSWREAATHAVSKRHQQVEAVIRAQRSLNQDRLLQSFRQWRKQMREARRERICMEKARRHHGSKLLSKAMKAWNEHHNQYQKNKVMKRQGTFLLRLKMYQKYFEEWNVKLQHRRREAKQTERALWHWSLTLQAKVLYAWRSWVTEQHRKQEQAARSAQIYRDQLLREGVTCILTYAAHMNDLTTTLTQHSQEQRSRHLQRVVRRCAMRWKQRALCKPRREKEVKGQLPRKTVTFCLTTPGVKSVSLSDSVEEGGEDELLSKLLLCQAVRCQPRRCEELFDSPLEIIIQRESAASGTEAVSEPSQLSCPSQENFHQVLSCFSADNVPVTSTQQSIITSHASLSEHRTSTMSSPPETQDVLLPPSAFMFTVTEDMTKTSGFKDAPLPFKQHSSAYKDIRLRASTGETAEVSTMDPTSDLTREMLSIQQDMKTYQQDRKQLRAWQKLKSVLQSWLETSGKDEQMEKKAVCEELKELEERIDRLSTELAKRKPVILLHVERIQHLQTVLTNLSVFTTRQETLEK